MRFTLLWIGLAAGCADRALYLPEVEARRDLSLPDLTSDAAVADAALADATVADAAPDLLCDGSPCAVEVAVSGDSSCVRFVDGTVRCWGDNRSGQLGQGAVSGSPPSVMPEAMASPAPLPGISAANGIGVGGSFTGGGASSFACAIAGADREVRCWGTDYYGQLGRGGPTVNTSYNPLPPPGPFYPDPAPVADLTGVDEIAVGGAHACARLGGEVRCWGSTNGPDEPPPAVPPIPGTRYPVFYRPTPFVIALPRPAIQISAGASGGQYTVGNVTCAVLDDASVACWGDGRGGLLGEEPAKLYPSGFGFHRVPIPPAKQVSVGAVHACAVTLEGRIWCWGSADNYTRGEITVDAGAQALLGIPTEVVLPDGEQAVQVAADYHSTCAVLGDGQVACWGDNSSYQAGRLSPSTLQTPTRVPGLTDIIQIAGSAPGGGASYHQCAVDRGGRVLCWGRGLSTATPVVIGF